MAAAYLIFGHLSFFVSPAIALLMGLVLVLAVGNPFHVITRRVSSRLLKYCLVGLGFGVNLQEMFLSGEVDVVPVFIAAVVAVAAISRLGDIWYGDSSNELWAVFSALAFFAVVLINSYITLPALVPEIALRISKSGTNAAMFMIGTGLIPPEGLKSARRQPFIYAVAILILVTLCFKLFDF